MRPKTKAVLAVLVVVAILVIALSWALGPDPLSVSVAHVTRGRVDVTVANTRAGTVKVERRAKLAPLTSGRVTVLNVSEGDRVEEGDVLLELWNEDLIAELGHAQSQVAAARARRDEATRNREYYEREAARLERLEEGGFESEGRFDLARTRAAAGRASEAAAEADVDVALHRVAVARAALRRTVLEAPFGGVVAEVNCELGEVVTPSPTGIPTLPAVELIDPRAPYVSAPIDEVDAPSITVGMSARIHLDAMGDRSFPGRVIRIAPYVLDVEKQARTLEVEVEFVDGGGVPGLLPGYSADVEILLDASEDTLRIPTQSLIRGDRVLVFREGEPLEERRIVCGLRNWQYTEVKEGLSESELIVVSPAREGVEAGRRAVSDPTSRIAVASDSGS